MCNPGIFFVVICVFVEKSHIVSKAELNDANYSAAHIFWSSRWQWLSLCQNDTALCCPWLSRSKITFEEFFYLQLGSSNRSFKMYCQNHINAVLSLEQKLLTLDNLLLSLGSHHYIWFLMWDRNTFWFSLECIIVWISCFRTTLITWRNLLSGKCNKWDHGCLPSNNAFPQICSFSVL